ncbi:MAG: DMT family transporter [Alphaproteobacteria bacterium]|nr:DMT family transporter [Alphaproteobacteria bacterium]
MLNRFTATLLLLLATMFWGFAFVAQKNAMEHMEPLTFIGARYFLGGLLILPLAWREYQRRGLVLSLRQWGLLAFLSLNFFLGSYLQQYGLIIATVTNSGFLTGLYVFFVPFILLVVFRTAPHPIVWLCAPLAFAGLFLLNGGRFDAMNSGDVYVMTSAVFWAMHVLMLGYLARNTGLPVFVSCVSFLAAGLVAELGSFTFEAPNLDAIAAGWVEILYAGIFSTAIAFTLQAVGQVHVPPANAAIILSGEALFAALGGAVMLGERLPGIGYLGAGLIFLAIVMVETVPALGRGRAKTGAV